MFVPFPPSRRNLPLGVTLYFTEATQVKERLLFEDKVYINNLFFISFFPFSSNPRPVYSLVYLRLGCVLFVCLLENGI